MQTTTFYGHHREHFSVQVERAGDFLTLRSPDELATVADDAEAAAWLGSRVLAEMRTVARIIIRETTPGLTVRALGQFGAPVEWQDTGSPR